ncbi:HAD-IIB family hydrolase [Vulcanisaeta souniana]|uniref:Haloacid dehalogenase n=1 Tax=Vulcanisaeta souniana JCM 11219 TaxID=1293586 RepID=A0A830E877_9CREN|nr:HAD-IIB family hydrolase [Vulcanisaeta souniana]BDR91141.1 hypothetical protein Vsou_02340 [Vulcanisaeta souniana JCM 11219]GGI81156.1 hypothetical protein GCM10007112_17380 [Vulcanisaeta souniana JCM 11219]
MFNNGKIDLFKDVSALFTDYDGTIAPIDVARHLSKPPESIYGKLKEISRRIPVAVISTKDCDFLIPRTDFASAWSCTNGLEIRTGNTHYIHEELPEWQDKFRLLMDLIKNSELREAYLEIKRVSGFIGGLGIDWRNKGSVNSDVLNSVINMASKWGFRVIRYRGHPFMDIYPGIPIDKGYAVAKLRELMEITGPIIYMGDSENDIPAMKMVEYPIGIRHKYNEGLNLPVLLWINEDELPTFLDNLLILIKHLPPVR